MATPDQLKRLGTWLTGQDTDGMRRLPRRMFWVGLAVRLLYITLAHTYRIRVILDHFQFGWEMGRIARAMVTGYGFADPFNGHSGPTAWTPPLYPLLIAAAFKLFGVYTAASAWVILAVNSIFSAATATLVYEMAWRCFGRTSQGLKVAVWSGWLWALYPACLQYAVHWVWDMALTTFLFSWLVALALRVRGVGEAGLPAQSTREWIVFGLGWGLVGLSNSSLLPFLPVMGLWMMWPELRALAGLGDATRKAALAAACCLAVLAPWVVRNYSVLHAFVPMRSNLGAELYQSVLPANQGFPWGTTLPLDVHDPEFVHYQTAGEIAYSRQQGERASQMIQANPAQFWRYVAKRVYFFWAGVPHPFEKSVAVELVREMNFAFGSVAALLGLGLALRQRIPGAWLMLWAFVLIPVPFYLITVQARFRSPLEPMMLILIVYLFQSAERKPRLGAA